MAIPLIHKLQATITEKNCTYQDLVFETKQQSTEQDYCYSTGLVCYKWVIPNTFNQSLTNINLPPCQPPQVQKVVTLNTCSIGRKFLSDEVHLSDEEADNP
jgi:hypothetical protein